MSIIILYIYDVRLCAYRVMMNNHERRYFTDGKIQR